MHRPDAILFDWDNTLIDNWGAIHIALNTTLVAMGHPEWSYEETQQRVRASLRDSFPLMFGERWPEARDIYYQTFAQRHLEGLTAKPGAEDMLRTVSSCGIYLGVVSNKTGRFLRAEAEYLGWTSLFSRLVGAADAIHDKPHTAPVILALAGKTINPGPAVWFVGDAGIDMQCAYNSGCSPILIGDADPGTAEFKDYPPAMHIVDCPTLKQLILQITNI
ncbi:MAG: HAD family hydrolase [Alphaproteobacteria bacterium]